MTITSHPDCVNDHSTYFRNGPYDGLADSVFAKESVNCLEYDDKKSDDFEPLAKVFPDKKVVLGLIPSKMPKMEEKDKIIVHIHEAGKSLPLDPLYLSPPRSFAS